MTEHETPISGDCIIFKRADGRYDVFKIGKAGKREHWRAGVRALNDAYQSARKNLEGGRVLYSDHSTPDVCETYRISK